VADLLGVIGFGSFLAVSLAVGIRLLLLARRTRKLPELAMGLNFVVAGFVGYSLLVATESLHLLPGRLAGFGSFFGVSGISIGAAFVCLFTQQVFHPQGRGARVVLALISGWLGLAGDTLPAENAYARRLKLYRGRVRPEELLIPADSGDVQVATLNYGLGNWYLLLGDTAQARAAFERSVQSGGWPAFGFIASEAELRRLAYSSPPLSSRGIRSASASI